MFTSDCTNCGQPLKDGASFCGECGAAVRHCPRCGQLLRDGSVFCGQCGATVNGAGPDSAAIVSPSAPPTELTGAQGSIALARIRFTLPKPFFAKLADFLRFIPITFTNTILLDGNELRTLEMGETIDLEVPVGQHVMQLVHAYRTLTTLFMDISRTSKPLELTVTPEALPMVSGVYDYLWQKFDLELQGYLPLR